MIVENIDINLLKPYSNNPRKLTPKAIEKVAQSLKEFGFRQPIVVDANNTNIIGQSKDGDNGYKVISEWGHEQIIIRNGKKYRKHKWKDVPEVEI